MASQLLSTHFTCADHDPPDVIGLDNNSAMLLAHSKKKLPMMSLLHYIALHSTFFLPVPKSIRTHSSMMLPPRPPRVLARMTLW